MYEDGALSFDKVSRDNQHHLGHVCSQYWYRIATAPVQLWLSCWWAGVVELTGRHLLLFLCKCFSGIE